MHCYARGLVKQINLWIILSFEIRINKNNNNENMIIGTRRMYSCIRYIQEIIRAEPHNS